MEYCQRLLEWRWCALMEWCYACLIWQLLTGFPVALSWVHLFCSVRNEPNILQSPNSREWERQTHPCVNLHREKQVPLRCWFRVFKVSCRIWVLKQSKPALLCCDSHITTLSVLTCVMNVRDPTRQAFVTCFCPFRYRTSKFIHRP